MLPSLPAHPRRVQRTPLRFGLLDLMAGTTLFCVHLTLAKIVGAFGANAEAMDAAIVAGFSGACALAAVFLGAWYSRIQEDYVYRMLLVVVFDAALLILLLLTMLVLHFGPLVLAVIGVAVLAFALDRLDGRRSGKR